MSLDQKLQFNSLAIKFGPDALNLVDRNSPILVSRGSSSPYSLEELSILSLPEVVEKVNSWQLQTVRGFKSPSIEGLADTFGRLISANAVAWSHSAMIIVGMKPRFISRALNGWLTYAREKGDLNWVSIIDLADALFAQHIQDQVISGVASVDVKIQGHDEKWARQCIVELISKACDHGADLRLRQRFMVVVGAMINEDPVSAVISRKENFLMRDHATDALNSARGKVATALCDLAVWTAKSDANWQASQANFKGNIAAFTDILKLIELHLSDLSNENAVTWSAYALRANQLKWLAPSWFVQHIASKLKIVGVSSGTQAPWIFWITFLKFHQAHRVWLTIFESTYVETANWLKEIVAEDQDKIVGLSDYLEHLMVYYWQKDLDIKANELVWLVFDNASPSRRMQTIIFVGQALKRGECPPPDVVERFQFLWGWYWTTFGISDVSVQEGGHHRHSLFGDWLACGHLGAEWSLRTFLSYLEHDSQADHGDDEFKRMSEWCLISPLQVLKSTNLLVISDLEGWRMHLWKESVRVICDQTKALSEVDINRARADLLEALIRRGHVDFLDGEDLGA